MTDAPPPDPRQGQDRRMPRHVPGNPVPPTQPAWRSVPPGAPAGAAIPPPSSPYSAPAGIPRGPASPAGPFRDASIQPPPIPTAPPGQLSGLSAAGTSRGYDGRPASPHGGQQPPSVHPMPGPPAPPRKRRRGLAITLTSIAAVVLVGGTIGGIVLVDYGAAHAEFSDAQEAAASAYTDLTRTGTDFTAVYSAADDAALEVDTMLSSFTPEIVPQDRIDALTAASAEVRSGLGTGEWTAPSRPRGDDSGSAGELREQAQRLTIEAESLQSNESLLRSRTNGLRDALTGLEDAAAAAWASVPAAAEAAVQKYAAGDSKLQYEFLVAADAVGAQTTGLSSDTQYTVATYTWAFEDLVASAQTTVAARDARGLGETRAAIESWARGFAPGLAISFIWSPVVNERGSFNNSVGGVARWWLQSDGSGYATIELSDSIAEWWGGPNSAIAEAVVVHEVGHAITVRCRDMYDQSTQPLIEEWATAFAISRGYLVDGNGVSLYGQPRDAIIAAAGQCH